MKGVISIFALPHEVENLVRVLDLLKRNSIIITGEVSYKISITVCMSLTDWDRSRIPEEYIRDRVKESTEKLLSWAEIDLQFEEGSEILGCVTHRKYTWRSNQDADFFIWLDPDIIFPDTALYYLEQGYISLRSQSNTGFIITPQILRFGDKSWDVLCHPDFLEKNFNYNHFADSYKDLLFRKEEPCLKLLQGDLKFGGGLMPLITKEFIDKIGIPDELGHYGLEDTFLMVAANTLVQNKVENFSQFILENVIAVELYTLNTSKSIKSYVIPIDRRDEFKSIAMEGFAPAMRNLLTKYNIPL